MKFSSSKSASMSMTPLICSVPADIDLFVVVVVLEVNNFCPRGNTGAFFTAAHKNNFKYN